MRPLICFVLLLVASVANAQDIGKKVFDDILAPVEAKLSAVHEAAREIPPLANSAVENGADSEAVGTVVNEFMQLGDTFMAGAQFISEGKVLANLAKSDGEYLDAAKRVLLGNRALIEVETKLSKIVDKLKTLTQREAEIDLKVGPPEA